MKLYEQEAKKILRQNGLSVPASTRLYEANIKFDDIPIRFPAGYVLKAQVLSGGRGKSGGIKFIPDAESAWKTAKEMIGATFVTPQNPEGEIIKEVLVEEQIAIKKEFYFCLAIDRNIGKPILMASANGGIDIEETAGKEPEKILKIVIEPLVGLQDFQIRSASDFLELNSKNRREFSELCETLFAIFKEKDLLILEINPLALTSADNLVCLDAKIITDDYALFRHKDFSKMDKERKSGEKNELNRAGLNYQEISEEEGIGIFSNGAGVLLDTLDRIKEINANPRSALDLGGTITIEQVIMIIRTMNNDPKIKIIFGNIYTALTGTKKVSDAMLGFLAAEKLNKPFVLRLSGRGADESMEDLRKHGVTELHVFKTTEEALVYIKEIILRESRKEAGK